jgi:NarL family two-component system response regulator LiaR
MALSQPTVAAGVYLVGKDEALIQALQKLLELDPEIRVLGHGLSIADTALAKAQPEVVVVSGAGEHSDAGVVASYLQQVAPRSQICLLDALGDRTLRDVLQAIKALAAPSASGERHLRAVHAPEKPRATAGPLSERELEVVRLVAEGLSNKEISVRLSLSDKTVKNHISHILAKMNLNARTQVAVYAIRAGLV